MKSAGKDKGAAFRLAGEHELADRIRSSRRRVTRRLVEGDGETAAEGSPAGDSQAPVAEPAEPAAAAPAP